MKRACILLLIIVSLLACKKEPELKTYVLEITKVEVETGTTTANIRATYSYPAELKSVYLKLSNNSDMSASENYLTTIDGNTLNVELNDLSVSTKYYYCFEYNNGVDQATTSVFNFITADYSLPIVNTKEVTNITATSAECGGNIIDDGGTTIIARGVCWGTSHNPTINNSHTNDDQGLGEFISSITGLETNVTYYVRAYATNNKGTAYGNENSFTTHDGLAVISTNPVSGITAMTAVCGGNVIDDSGYSVTERGICWSTNNNPTINNSHISNGNGLGEFTSTITGLETNVTYYVRAYAINSKGTAYGDEQNFTTQDGLAVVNTNPIINITATTASSGGNIIDDGGFNITARGVCWNIIQNPTINNNHTMDGTGIGDFSSLITGLDCNITYYVRAYATNSKGTAYGEEVFFTTQNGLAIVSTNEVTNIGVTTAISGGNIINDNGFGITARGVCWSTNPNPTINDSHSNDGGGMGVFTSTLTNLTEYTTYYVRAFATNSCGTAYGSQVMFRTIGDHPEGSINSLFSINASQRVYFSKGNLQYKASTHTWKFADNQYDIIGNNNTNISSTYSGWIDLFGWGTGNNPTNSSTNSSAYAGYADWGNNAISNGGNETYIWRTLTAEEWYYLLRTRNTVSGIRYAKAKVNGINGLILLPDNWNSSYYNLNNTNVAYVNFTSNVITLTAWKNIFEEHGAVFLPAGGSRYGTTVYDSGGNGYYWSSTGGYGWTHYYIYFTSSECDRESISSGYPGFSVRLVQEYYAK